jgi:hypothetical protein
MRPAACLQPLYSVSLRRCSENVSETRELSDGDFGAEIAALASVLAAVTESNDFGQEPRRQLLGVEQTIPVVVLHSWV